MSEGLKPAIAVLIITATGIFAQAPATRPAFEAFEVATIKPTPPDYQGGRFIRMQSAHVFAAKNYASATLRKLLADRFRLTFHRQQKELSIYTLTVAKNGPKLKESAAPPEEPPVPINRIFPGRVLLPARNATMGQFASMMQRAVTRPPGGGQDRALGQIRFRAGMDAGRYSIRRTRAAGIAGNPTKAGSFRGGATATRTEVGSGEGAG
jgi:Protein of unknown function (DUF3738)